MALLLEKSLETCQIKAIFATGTGTSWDPALLMIKQRGQNCVRD